MQQTSVDLSVMCVELTEDRLALTYEVTNHRENSIFAFSSLFDTDRQGNRTIQSDLAYVHVNPPKDLTIAKSLKEIPSGIKVEVAEIPYLEEVNSEDVLSGSILINLPATTYLPYPYKSSPSHRPMYFNKAIVQIGILDPSKAQPDEALIDSAHGVGKGLYICDYGLGLEYQELLQQKIFLTRTIKLIDS